MRFVILIALTLSVASLLVYPSPAGAETYYVSDSTWNPNASDGNDGLSWSSPFAHPNKLSDVISCGDTALFGSGIWEEVMIVPPKLCDTTGLYTVYACSSYVTADSMANMMVPELRGGQQITSWTDTIINGVTCYKAYVDYIYEFGDGYVTSVTQDGLMLTHDEGDGFVSPAGIDQDGECFGSSDKMVYIRPYNGRDPNTSEIFCAAHPAVYLTLRGSTQRIKFWGLKLRYGAPFVVGLSSGSFIYDVVIQRCDIRYAGGTYHSNASVIGGYGTTFELETSKLVVDACSLQHNMGGVRNGSSVAPPREGLNHGGAITLYEAHQCVFSNNWFLGYTASGIILKGIDNEGHGPWEGNVIRNNVFIAEPFYDDDDFPGPTDAVNLDFAPYKDSVYGNYITEGWSTAIRIGGSGNGDQDEHWNYNIFFCNNTIYGVRGECVYYFRGPKNTTHDDCGQNNEVKYNIFAHSSMFGDPNTYDIGFRQSEALTNCEQSLISDYNVFYDPSSDFSANCAGGGTANWSEWRSLLGGCEEDWAADVNSSLDDPQFASPHNTTLTAIERFNRPYSTQEINVTYGGRNWTRYGAWQPEDGSGGSDPHIELDKIGMSFSAAEGGSNPDPQTFTISNSGGGTLEWSVLDDASWLSCSPSSGSGNATITVDVSIGSLGVGTYNGIITVSSTNADNSPQTISVQLQVFEPSSNIALGHTVTVSGTYDDNYSSDVLTDGIIDADGGTSATWASDDSDDDHWIEVDFGSSQTVKSIALYWALNNYSGNWMISQEVRIQRYTGSSYVTVATVESGECYLASLDSMIVTSTDPQSVTMTTGTRSITITGFTPFETSRLRFYQPSQRGPISYNNIMWLTEVEAYYDDITPPRAMNECY